jgi:hypothetical protein
MDEKSPTTTGSTGVSRPVVPPLPATREALIAQRKTLTTKVLNDYVDEVYLILWDDPEFRRFLEAVYNEEAIEGSTKADDLEAARMIREYAKANNIPMLPSKKLETIAKALNVVTRRYRTSRKERRSMIGGEHVDIGYNDNE